MNCLKCRSKVILLTINYVFFSLKTNQKSDRTNAVKFCLFDGKIVNKIRDIRETFEKKRIGGVKNEHSLKFYRSETFITSSNSQQKNNKFLCFQYLLFYMCVFLGLIYEFILLAKLWISMKKFPKIYSPMDSDVLFLWFLWSREMFDGKKWFL